MENIVQEIESKKQEFSSIENKIQEYQKYINEFTDELKRLQGEYRLLVKLGYEQGILDEQGNPISQK